MRLGHWLREEGQRPPGKPGHFSGSHPGQTQGAAAPLVRLDKGPDWATLPSQSASPLRIVGGSLEVAARQPGHKQPAGPRSTATLTGPPAPLGFPLGSTVLAVVGLSIWRRLTPAEHAVHPHAWGVCGVYTGASSWPRDSRGGTSSYPLFNLVVIRTHLERWLSSSFCDDLIFSEAKLI